MRFSIKKLIAIALMLVMVIELPGQVVAKGLENAKGSNSVTDVSKDFTNSAELTLSAQKSGEITAAGSADYYIFNCTGSGKYSFYTTGDMDTVGYLYDGSQQQLVNNDDDYFDKNFCINYSLEAGKSYYIKVTAHSQNAVGKYNIIAEKSSDKIPDAPINITATNKDYTSITISWDKLSDDEKVKEYDIYRDGVKITNVFDNSYKDANLQPGTNYVYTIKACNMYGNYSEESAKYSAATDKDTTAPDAVQGLEVSYNCIYYTSDGYKGDTYLEWDPSKDNVNVEGYYVYRDNEKIGEADKNYYSRPEYHDSGLQIKREYTYTVRAYDAAGNISDVSAPVKYTINDESNNVIDLNTAQSIDCGKEITVNSTVESQNMLFSFQPSESGYYYVKVDTSSSYSDVRWFKDLSDIYNDYSGLNDIKNLTAGEKYYFNFKTDSIGEFKVTVIGPDKEAPSKPIISNAQCDYDGRIRMDIAISDNLPHGITYDVYKNGVPIAKKQEYYTYYNSSYCTFIDKDIVAEGTYNYDIVAYDTAGNKSDKTSVTVNVPGDYSAIKNLTGQNSADSSIKLYWNNGCYVKGCKIYRNGVKIGETNQSSYTDTGLISGSKYTYAVKPYDANGKLYDELTIDITAQADDYGNDFKTASPINIDNNVTGQIDYYDDVDFLSFTVPKTGNYAINFSGTTVCELYDEKQQFLSSTWNSKGCISKVLYSGKSYYLKIEDGTPGQYSLNFIKNAVSNIQSCKPAIDISVNSRDVYITSYLENPYAVGFNLYRNSEKIATVNDSTYYDVGLLPNNKYTYKIQCFDVDGNLSQQSDEFSVTTLNDDYGDDISSAAPLQLDNNTTGIINCGDDKDFFSLTPKQSGNYVISGHFDNNLKVTVTDKDGNEINGQTTSGDFSNLIVSLKGNNVYYINISNGNQSGYFYNPINYKISVSLKQDDYGDDTSTATSIQTDSNIKGAINYSGDKDFISISPKVSGNYTISGHADTSMYITVLDQSGKEVKSLDVSNDFSSFSVALNGNSIYYIELSSYNSSVNYNFTVSLKTNISAPDKLNAFSTGSHSNCICWNYSNADNRNYAAGFKIFRDGKQIGDTLNYYYNDIGLNPGTPYIYTIKAYDDFGNISELSSSLSSSTWPIEYSHDYKNPSEISLDTEINTYTYPLYYINDSGSYSNVSFFSFTPDSEGSYEINYEWNPDNNGYLNIELFDENYIPIGFEESSILYREENGSYVCSQPYNLTGQWQSLLASRKLDAGKKYYIEITEYYYGNVADAKLSKAVDNISEPSPDKNILNLTDSNYTFMLSKTQPVINSFTANTKDNEKVDFKWDVPDNINNIQGFIIYKDNEYIGDSGHPGIYIPSGSTREFIYDQKDNIHIGDTYSILAIYDDGRISDLYGPVGITAVDTVPPSKPDDLALVSRGCKFVKLVWASSNDNYGVKGYAIYKNGEKLKELTVDEPNNSFSANMGCYSFNDTSVKVNTKYTYTVRAFDYSGNYSEDSNPLTVTTCDDDYGDDYTSAYDITSALNSDSQIKGTINDTEDTDFFSFVPAQSGLYTFTSTGDTDLCGYLYDENQNILQCNDDINDKDANFYIQQRLEAGKKYYLKVAFQNGRGTGDYTLITQLKDEIPPTVPQNIRITSLTGKSTAICWDESSDNIAVSGYEIYRDGIKVGDTKDLTFKDTGLTQNQKYIYTVKAYDASGNYSAASTELEATPSAPEITDVEPADKSVIGGEKITIKIHCNNYYDTSSAISIKHSTDGTSWNSAEGSFPGSYNGQDGNPVIPYEWNIKSLNTGNCQIKIDMTDSDGCSTEKIISYSVDRTPPASPEELTAETEFKAVKLTWKASQDNNVSFYKVYRSDSENGAYSSIASVYGNNSFTYEDRSLEYNKNYYYKVTAVDIFDQEGDFSNISYAMASNDITPPTVPVNLRMDCVSGNSAKIQWDFSTDNMGVLGYEIYRDGTKVGQTNSSINYFTDKGLTTNSTYKYTVKAFDASGNYSDYSKELLAVPMLPDIKSITPDAGSIIGGKNANFQIYVKNMGDYSLAKVQAQYSADCITWKDADCNASNIAETGTDEYSVHFNWNMHDLTSGNYSLKLKLCDSDGNVTDKVIPYVVDRTAPGIPSMFIAFSDYLAVQLKWRAPSDSDIKLYKIYRSDSADGTYTMVGIVNSSDKLTFKDSNLTGGNTYYYKITAVDNFDQEGNFSESASAAALVDDVKPLINAISPKDNTIFGGSTNITVTAEDNYKLSCVTLQYQPDGSDAWNNIGTIYSDDKNASVNFKWNTSKLNGKVKVRAIAKDYFGNIGDDSPIRTYTIDTVPPAKVGGLTYTAFPTSIYLAWSDVPDNDLDYFEVFMKTSDNDNFMSLGKVYNKVQFTASGLKPDSTYCFKIAAYDTQGNKGEDSDMMQVKTLSDNVSPSIATLGPDNGYYTNMVPVTCEVKDNYCVGSLSLQMSNDRITWNEIANLKPDNSTSDYDFKYDFNVAGLSEGKYYLRAIADDTCGNRSDSAGAPPYISFNVDRTPPVVVKAFQIVPHMGYITIKWQQNFTDTIKCYNIYRATDANGPFKLQYCLSQIDEYIDYNVEKDTNYYYKITSVDLAGNEGPASDIEQGMLLKDTETPKIVNISPTEGIDLPKNPNIGAVVSDNYKVTEVKAEYCAEGSDSWNTIEDRSMNTRIDLAAFKWKTDGLSEGIYKFRYTVTDASGNITVSNEIKYKLNANAPGKPQATAEGIGKGVKLTWTRPSDSDMEGYRILRSTSPDGGFEVINQTPEENYTDTKLKPGTTYYYKIEAVDRCYNAQDSDIVSAVPTYDDTQPPVAVCDEKKNCIITDSVTFDGSKSSDDSGIAEYSWDFGDGSTAQGAVVNHVYSQPGQYMAALTVTDVVGKKSSCNCLVTVYPADGASYLQTQVVDDVTGEPLSGACVAIKLSDDTTEKYITDESGNVVIVEPLGQYDIYAYTDKYEPAHQVATVTSNLLNKTTIRLKKGDVVVGNITTHRMTIQEIKDAGIDISDPDNNYSYRVTIILNNNTGGAGGSFSYDVNNCGIILGVGGVNNNYYICDKNYVVPFAVPCKGHPEVAPATGCMVIPIEGKWLKEFFSIHLTLQNTASSEFYVDGTQVGLEIPEGLSLAPTKEHQYMTRYFDKLAGGETKEFDWIVRGDTPGNYQVGAYFSGFLEPFGEPISANFVCPQQITVMGGTALSEWIRLDDPAQKGVSYNIMVRLSNRSDFPEYNISMNLLEGEGYTIPALEKMLLPYTIDELPAHSAKAFNFYVIPQTDVFMLNSSDIQIQGSGQVPKTSMSINSVKVKRKGFVGAIDKLLGDPIDSSSGSHEINKTLLAENGAIPLTFEADYDSSLLEEGIMGKGWTSNYESYVEKSTDGRLIVHWDSNHENAFESESTSSSQDEKIYYAQDKQLQGEQLRINSDGTYKLTRKNGSIWYFNDKGYVTKITDKSGFSILVGYDSSNKVHDVTEPVSGEKISYNYNDKGLLNSVTDTMGRIVRFSYDSNDCLTEFTDANGNITHYSYTEDGKVLSCTDTEGRRIFNDYYDENGKISKQDDGVDGNQLTELTYKQDTQNKTFTTTAKDRLGNIKVLVYDYDGNLLSEKDPLGNTTTYTYDKSGSILSKKDPLGNVTKFTYDDNGNVTSITDSSGKVTTMQYDSNNNLISTKSNTGAEISTKYNDRNQPVEITDQLNNKTAFEYDDNGLLIKKTTPNKAATEYTYENGRIKTQKDADGVTKTYEYDAAGRVTAVYDKDNNKTSYEYDNCNSIKKITDALKNETEFGYDSHGNKIYEKDAKGNVTSYTYNGNLKLTDVKDALNNETKYGYDGEDNLTSITDAKGNVQSYVYDQNGRLLQSEDKEGKVTKYTYDADGNVMTETSPKDETTTYTYEKGILKSVIAANGAVTSYEYDDAGRLKAEIDPLNNKTEYGYDNADDLLSVADALGHKISYTYDENHNRITQSDANGNITTYGYSPAGRMTSIKDASGSETHYEYDGQGRLSKTTAPDGGVCSIAYDELGRVISVTDTMQNTTKMEYDALGNLTVQKDAYDKQIMTAEYDALGRVTKQTDALSRTVQYKYDNVGNLIQTVNPAGQTSTVDYDKLGRTVKAVDALNGNSSETYDDDGRIETLKDPNNNEVKYTYDSVGNLIQEDYSSGRKLSYQYDPDNQLKQITNGRQQNISMTYDAAGRNTTLVTPEDTVNMNYDSNGNLLEEKDSKGTISREYDSLNRVKKYTDANGNTISYSYDNVGNLTALTYPDGKTVTYQYNLNNQLTCVTDWNGRKTTYDYDKNGRLIKTERPDGSAETKTYDDAGQVLTSEDKDKSGNIINSFSYKYDLNGNVISEENAKDNQNPSLSQPLINTESKMTYGADNRLLTFNNVKAEYDADGNMTSGPISSDIITGDGTSTASFNYDSQNRLIQAENTTYSYDAEGNRISVNENGKTTTYVVNPQSGLSQILVKTGTDGKKTYYVYGLGLISEETEGGKYLLHHYDRRGSTIALTDINGAVTDTFKYATYGELVSRTGSTDTPFLFCGLCGVMTDNNGLYYMRARYYNPIIKRFMNADVVTGNVVDSGSMNRYAYVNGNPISYIDPFGLCADADRATSGTMKIIFGVAIAALCVISVVTTIGTFGLDIPLLAGIGLLSDGCMAAMAVSDIDEGFQDAIYGKYGANIETHNYICDHVFAGNKTAYMITELALGGLSWAGAKSLAGYAGEKIAAEGLDNTIDDSFNIVDRSIDETATDSEKMLGESGSRLALPEPEKLLELPPPEARLALPPPEGVGNPVVSNVETKALTTYYPPNNGALGAVERKYLMPGDTIDRFGKLGGKYFSPTGTPMEMRALPPDADLSIHNVFKVVKPFEVESSTIAPAFNKMGLGTQFRSAVSAEILLKRGIIVVE